MGRLGAARCSNECSLHRECTLLRSDSEAASKAVWADRSGGEGLGTSDIGCGEAVMQRETMSTEYFRRDGGHLQ